MFSYWWKDPNSVNSGVKKDVTLKKKKQKNITFHPKTEKIIDIIVDLLTEEELKSLEIEVKGKKISFKEQMIINYYYSKPRCSHDQVKEMAEKKLKSWRLIIPFAKKEYMLISRFIDCFNHLFKVK